MKGTYTLIDWVKAFGFAIHKVQKMAIETS
jgi:hypothetical protein